MQENLAGGEVLQSVAVSVSTVSSTDDGSCIRLRAQSTAIHPSATRTTQLRFGRIVLTVHLNETSLWAGMDPTTYEPDYPFYGRFQFLGEAESEKSLQRLTTEDKV